MADTRLNSQGRSITKKILEIDVRNEAQAARLQAELEVIAKAYKVELDIRVYR
jgi:hypothetical protein